MHVKQERGARALLRSSSSTQRTRGCTRPLTSKTFSRQSLLVRVQAIYNPITSQIPSHVLSIPAAVPVDTDVLPTPQPAAQALVAWTSRWWPVAPLDGLDSKAPQHVDLLDMSLVVWADSQGLWHATEDKCPHRLAPLSEGRVEGDQLMCSYHGWKFNSSGVCTHIPQLDHDRKVHDTACKSKRSCAKTYPTFVAHGLLWVWPESGAKAAMQALGEPVPEMKSEGWTQWMMRDLSLRYDTVLENLLDPSHVAFAHHGVLGNRSQPGVWNTLFPSEVTSEGFDINMKTPVGILPAMSFNAPGIVKYNLGAQLLVVPSKPGWTRFISNYATVAPGSVKIPLWKQIRNHIAFLDHEMRNSVFDGDASLLHFGERLLPVNHGIGKSAVAKACYIPAPADTAVLSLRQWIQQFAGPIPTCKPTDDARMPQSMTREQLFNRWEQHTKNCGHCKRALSTLDKVQFVNMAVGTLAAFAAISTTTAATVIACTTQGSLSSWWEVYASSGLPFPMAGSITLLLLAAAAYNILASFRKRFFFVDYVHSEHN